MSFSHLMALPNARPLSALGCVDNEHIRANTSLNIKHELIRRPHYSTFKNIRYSGLWLTSVWH